MNKSGQEESSESGLSFINNKLTKMIFDIRNFFIVHYLSNFVIRPTRPSVGVPLSVCL